MKTALLFAVTLACTSITISAQPNESKMYGYLYSGLVQACEQTRDDDKHGLLNTLKSYRISKKAAVTGIVCNGQQLMDFARANQAVKVTAMLQPYEDRIKGRVTISDVAAAGAN